MAAQIRGTAAFFGVLPGLQLDYRMILVPRPRASCLADIWNFQRGFFGNRVEAGARVQRAFFHSWARESFRVPLASSGLIFNPCSLAGQI